MKTDLLQACGNCWAFQIFWHFECSIFTASFSMIWNSSTGIPSHPLALFVVMLSKAHLTLHSRMLGSRWVITPSWLSGLEEGKNEFISWNKVGSSHHYSCLENSIDRGAWRVMVHRVANSCTWLKWLSAHTHTQRLFWTIEETESI